MNLHNISGSSSNSGASLISEPIRNEKTTAIDIQKILMPERNEQYVLKAHKIDDRVMYDMYYRNTLVFSSRCAFGRRLAITENIGFNDQDLINLCTGRNTISNTDITHLSLPHYTDAFKGTSRHGFWCDQSTEQLREFLHQFPNLVSVDMFHGKNHIETVVQNCPNLTSINLSWYIALSSRNIERLISINLGDWRLVNDLQLIAKYCPNLTSIDLSRCHAQGVKEFAQALTNLKSINLRNCKDITTGLVETIAKSCPKLISINLGNLGGREQIEDPAIKAIADNCPDLESLNLDGCYYIHDDALSQLTQRCQKLKSLSVKDCQFSDQLLQNLSCPNLTFIDFTNSRKITDEGIQALITKCPHLSSISLASCTEISDASIEIVAKGLKGNLTEMNLLWFNVVNEKVLLFLAKYCPDLRSIKLGASAYRISDIDRVIQVLGKGCQNLSELTLSYDQLSNKGFEALAKSLANLTSIELQYSDITDAGLEALAANCPKLLSIKLIICREITNDGYANFKRAHPHIEISRLYN